MDPVMIMYKESEAINALIAEICSRPPDVEYVDEKTVPPPPPTEPADSCSYDCASIASCGEAVAADMTGCSAASSASSPDENSSNPSIHRAWVISADDDVARITEAFSAIDSLYIADGHHRTASACK